MPRCLRSMRHAQSNTPTRRSVRTLTMIMRTIEPVWTAKAQMASVMPPIQNRTFLLKPPGGGVGAVAASSATVPLPYRGRSFQASAGLREREVA